LSRSEILSPASSMVSYETSRSIRCCGSILEASKGEMPKKPESNLSISLIKPPFFTLIFPALLKSPANNESASHLSEGMSWIAFFLLINKSQNSFGEFTSPGKRHPMPIIANASLVVVFIVYKICNR